MTTSAGEYTKPKADEDRKIRACLLRESPRCPGKFMSDGPGDRICKDCKGTKRWMSAGMTQGRW